MNYLDLLRKVEAEHRRGPSGEPTASQEALASPPRRPARVGRPPEIDPHVPRIQTRPERSEKPTQSEWLAAWRELADFTAGLFPDDPRVGPVLHALEQCNEQFQRGNWSAFLRACNGVLDALRFAPPLKPGWLIAYRDAQGWLCGGCDDRTHGTIACVERTVGGWVAVLTDGGRIPANRIVSVAETDETGRVIGAWTRKAQGNPILHQPRREANRTMLCDKDGAMRPGTRIYWRSMDGIERGPATIEGTLPSEGGVWLWFSFGDTNYLIRKALVTKVDVEEKEQRGGQSAST